MKPLHGWSLAYWLLWAAVIVTAALNMLRVRAGFLTNHAADIVVPALLYIMMRGLVPQRRKPSLLQRWFGSSPERAAAVLFLASTVTEVSQYYWPRGLFPGRFDPLDIVAFGAGVGLCYACDKRGRAPEPGEAG